MPWVYICGIKGYKGGISGCRQKYINDWSLLESARFGVLSHNQILGSLFPGRLDPDLILGGALLQLVRLALVDHHLLLGLGQRSPEHVKARVVLGDEVGLDGLLLLQSDAEDGSALGLHDVLGDVVGVVVEAAVDEDLLEDVERFEEAGDQMEDGFQHPVADVDDD